MLNPFSSRKVLKHGLPGRATIVSMGALERGASMFNLPMTLQVFVEGMTPYEVEDQWWVKARDCEALGGSVPVRVDREDPANVAIDWDALRDEHERSEQQRRDALAALGPWQGGPTGMAVPGLDAAAMAQVQEALGATFGAPAPAAPSSDEDVVSKLERLAALRDSGALTAEEFDAQKRRLLGT